MKMVYTVILYCVCLWYLVGVLGDSDEIMSVSVMEGDSVTLNSGLTEKQIDDFTEWRLYSTRIAKANIPEYDNDRRFKHRLKLDQTGSLTITNTRTTDSGLYQLSTIVGSKEIIKRFNVTVDVDLSSITTQQESVNTEVSLVVLISAAAAGSLLIVAAVGIFWICRKHRRTDQEVQTRDEGITYADPMFYKRNTQTASIKQEDEVVYAGVVTRR